MGLRQYNSLYFILFASFLLLTGGCKKDDPTLPQNSLASFYFNGTLNGNSNSLTVGTNNLYMFTGTGYDSTGIAFGYGEIKDHDCNYSCANDFKVLWSNANGSQQISADSLFRLGYFAFAKPDNDSSWYSVHHEAQWMGQGSVTAINWDFGDGSQVKNSFQREISHTYTHPGIYQVSVAFVENGNVIYSFSNRVQVGSVGGDSTSVQIPPHQFATRATGLGSFRVESITPLVNNKHLGTVTIVWKDANGKIWTSFNNKQSLNSSYFLLEGFSEYGKNSTGLLTKKVQISFACQLFNGNSVLNLTNGKACIAVAY